MEVTWSESWSLNDGTRDGQDFLVRVCELLTIWHKPWDGMQLGHINQAWLDIHWNNLENQVPQ